MTLSCRIFRRFSERRMIFDTIKQASCMHDTIGWTYAPRPYACGNFWFRNFTNLLRHSSFFSLSFAKSSKNSSVTLFLSSFGNSDISEGFRQYCLISSMFSLSCRCPRVILLVSHPRVVKNTHVSSYFLRFSFLLLGPTEDSTKLDDDFFLHVIIPVYARTQSSRCISCVLIKPLFPITICIAI